MHRDAAEGEEPGARDAGATAALHSMIDALIETLALATTVTLGVVMGGLVAASRGRQEFTTAERYRVRAHSVVLVILGVAEVALAFVRGGRDASLDGEGALPQLTVAAALLVGVGAIAMSVWRWRSSASRAAVDPRPMLATNPPPASLHADVASSTDRDAAAASLLPIDHLATPGSPATAGTPEGALGEGRDGTDFDVRLMHANRMQSIGRLAGGIAHDFNNLLTSILTSAEMAREALPDEHGIRPDLEEIRRAGTRASELTRQLLAFARRDVSRPRVIDVNMLVGSLATMLHRLLGETITLRISLGEALPLVLADPAQLEQVIVNLAVNARDAMVHGGELQLRTSRGEAQRHSAETAPLDGVVLEVQDSGIGMSEDVRVRLFEPFYTTKTPGRGTGLGLATCQAIVSAHGGEIAVDSALGAGSTFRVWLPATDVVDDSRATAEHPAPPPLPRDAPRTILLVEDDADVRGSTARALRRAGYAVLEAMDGEDALQLVASRPDTVDLILTDIVMPRMGGAELVRRLSAQCPEAHVIYMSGYPADSPEVAQVEALGLHVLEKPYTPAILLFEIRLKFDALRRA
ncbi:MAG: response regulator [Gemmatimonadaceae bacterium]|nr:response regulator [Gemmatimonadaceae bacterium]